MTRGRVRWAARSFTFYFTLFLVSNYFCMFCEGLYLHTVLVVAFLSENSIMKWFHLIEWALPAVVTATYAGVRAFITEETNQWVITKMFIWTCLFAKYFSTIPKPTIPKPWRHRSQTADSDLVSVLTAWFWKGFVIQFDFWINGWYSWSR